jgi:hypothetical protein
MLHSGAKVELTLEQEKDRASMIDSFASLGNLDD